MDPTQIKLLEERVILVDSNDRVLGHESKKASHLVENINNGMLHRAFSVFLFNAHGELLLQQRASQKITFPDYWTNTCCSHPLFTPDELQEDKQLGIRLAAIRKLEHELGIPRASFQPEDFTFMTRLHYKAASDPVWGEHEVDYILIVTKDVALKPNPNEVRDVCYLSASDLSTFFARSDLKFTPWFKLIVEHFLAKWWPRLKDLAGLEDTATIHHL